MAVLRRDDEGLPPRARALARLAKTLTAEPWSLSGEHVKDVRGQGLEELSLITALAVVSMFNYLTRVADATGIEFDYETALPRFEPDRGHDSAERPGRPVQASSASSVSDLPASASPASRVSSVSRVSPGADGGAGRRLPEGRLRTAWEAWRSYALGSDQPLSVRDRAFVARVAAEESADWETAEALGDPGSARQNDDVLTEFARKLSRQPWLMKPDDLDALRAGGYSEQAILHVISVTAHQNADSRLSRGLTVLTTS